MCAEGIGQTKATEGRAVDINVVQCSGTTARSADEQKRRKGEKKQLKLSKN